jgi:hypothetical protein
MAAPTTAKRTTRTQMEMEIVESMKAKYGAVAQSSLSNDHAGVRAVAQALHFVKYS